MKSLCVFCGSSFGNQPKFKGMAHELGKSLASQEITLIYGGASIGLMGEVADAALAEGGKVVGVMPEQLVAREVSHSGLSDLIVVQDMHERKAKMAELSDGFIALPGGLGTLEELFEVLTWAQLRFHRKPCGILNINGYYDFLLRFLDNAVSSEFIRPPHREMLVVSETVAGILALFENYQPPSLSK